MNQRAADGCCHKTVATRCADCPFKKEPDWIDSKTPELSLWKNPLFPMNERLEIADGAIRFRDEVIANLRRQLAEAQVNANRWKFSMWFQDAGDEKPQAIMNMWRKVMAEGRLRPSHAEYEAATDEAIKELKNKLADSEQN